MKDLKLVTVMTFRSLQAAHMAAAHLEEEGVEVFLADEMISQIYSNITGGIRLQVSDANFKKSQDILKNAGVL